MSLPLASGLSLGPLLDLDIGWGHVLVFIEKVTHDELVATEIVADGNNREAYWTN